MGEAPAFSRWLSPAIFIHRSIGIPSFFLAPSAPPQDNGGMKRFPSPSFASATVALLLATSASAADNPFVGNWALSLPNGGAGWLGVTQEKNYIDASLLWGGGSVVPLDSAFLYDGAFAFTRVRDVQRKDAAGKVVRTQRFTDAYIARLDGDELVVTALRPRNDSAGVDKEEFTGKRIPPVPPAPDLTKVKFGEPIQLLNGKDLTGWRLTNPRAANGWSVSNGILANNPVQEEGKPHKNYGNLRTDREFEDFNLTLDVRVPKDGNSGVYLRGVYEIQVMDSYGKKTDSHNMGALYSRITPSASVEKPAGEWQTLDITLVDRHLTVVLNGTKIIANQPVLGVTGGALSPDEFKPGPLYLQGDHAGVEYRNVVLRPVVK